MYVCMVRGEQSCVLYSFGSCTSHGSRIHVMYENDVIQYLCSSTYTHNNIIIYMCTTIPHTLIITSVVVSHEA